MRQQEIHIRRCSSNRGLRAGFRSFRRGVAFCGFLILLVLSVFFLVVRDFVSDARGRRDEGARVDELRNPVGAVLTLGGEDRIRVRGRIAAEAMESIQIQIFIPGAGDA